MQTGASGSDPLLRDLDFDLRQTLHASKAVRLWRLLTGYHHIYVLATLCLGGAALARAGSLYLLRFFVDSVLMSSASMAEAAPRYALGFILIAAGQGTSGFYAGRLAAQAAEGACCRIRNFLYDHLQRLPFDYHDRTPAGDLLQRTTSDVEAIRKLIALHLMGLGRIVMLLMVYIAAMFSLHGRLTLISLATIPVVLGISIWFFPRFQKRYDRYQAQEARLSTRFQENLSGIRVVRAFVRQRFEIDLTEKENGALLREGVGVVRMHAYYWPISDLITMGQVMVSTYVGGLYLLSGEMTLGAFLAFTGMLGQLMFPIRNLGRLVTQISVGWVSFMRITEILKQNRETVDEVRMEPPGDIRGELRFSDVGFSYEGTERRTENLAEESEEGPAVVLDGVNLHARPGEVVAVLGPTGSGKSTLMSLIPRFYETTSGRILLDGRELNQYPREFIRRNVGIVLQEAFLFSTTVRENLLFGVGHEIDEETLFNATRAAHIHDSILEFPQGYDTIVGEKGVTLSGGQKQRITIARTLLKDPRILILDDALSAVDLATEAKIRSALQQLMRGRTTFIIGHRIQSIMHADRILVLDKGRVVQTGTHEELVDQPGLYRDVHRIQSQIEVELQQDLEQSATEASLHLAEESSLAAVLDSGNGTRR